MFERCESCTRIFDCNVFFTIEFDAKRVERVSEGAVDVEVWTCRDGGFFQKKLPIRRRRGRLLNNMNSVFGCSVEMSSLQVDLTEKG